MNPNSIDTIELLRIDNVELYHTRNGYGALINKGTLFLLYAQNFNWFFLKINEFTYGLSKNIPVLASHNEKDAVATYVFVSTEGYYIIRIPTVSRQEILESLEETLKHNTQFVCKEGLDNEGLPMEVKEGGIQVRRTMSEGQKEEAPKGLTTAHVVYNGGKTTKNLMINSAQAVSEGITKLGGYIQSNYLEKQEEMKIDPKTMSRMALVNSATGMVSSVGSIYVRGLTTLGSWIAKKIEPKFEQKKHDAELKEQAEAQKPSGTVGQAALHSAVTVWTGMIESLDIIRGAITETTSNMVTHKYGSAAGEVFRSGIGIATNVGIPGNKLFKKN